MDEISVRPIGVVRNGEPDAARGVWAKVRSRLELDPGLGEALLGLEDYSHVIVLGWLHEMPEEFRLRRQAYPAGDPRYPLQGSFALRGGRPNPISVSVCRLVAIEGDTVVVDGLDLIDGTPVLDVKPYLAAYDSVPKAKIPKWAKG
jgi:tRNA (adenine37-N6)-methyltransferase